MALSKEPFETAFAPDSEFESANAGWDPYVASLLGEKSGNTAAEPPVRERRAPVMTITRRIANALLNKKR
jgi:hypothetical protein